MVTMVEPNQHNLALPDGSMLAEYRVERVLGVSGFGITYLAADQQANRTVAIEEYLPNDIARRQGTVIRPRSTAHDGEFRRGREQFLATARALLEVRHPNLAPAQRVFEAQNTAYLVMEHEIGERLDVLLARHERDFEESELRRITVALLDGLEALGAATPVHGSIEPSGIQLRTDGSPVLMNLAASRGAAGRNGRHLAIGLSPGYAAIEQYTGRAAQGPWTDIYALGGVLYRVVTGRDPLDAPARVLEDEQLPASRLAVGRYSRKFLRAIDVALAARPEDRPQSIAEWREMLAAPAVTERVAPAAATAAAKPGDDKAAGGELRAERDSDGEDTDWEPSGGFWRDVDWSRYIPYGVGAVASAGVIALVIAAVGSDRYREELSVGRQASQRLAQERLAEAERILGGLPQPPTDGNAPETAAPAATEPPPPPAQMAEERRAREAAEQRQQAEARAAEEQRQREAAAQRERERAQAEARAAEEQRQREAATQRERERAQAEAKAADERRQREAAAQRERQQAEARAAEEQRQREAAAQRERERQQAEAKAAEERRQREAAAQQERERQQAEMRAAEDRRQREAAAQRERERQQAETRAAEERRQREIAAQQERERQQAEMRAAEERRQRDIAAQRERERQQAEVRAAEEQRAREAAAAEQERQRQVAAAARAAEEQRAREAATARQRELASAGAGAPPAAAPPQSGRLLGTIGPSSGAPAASAPPPRVESAPVPPASAATGTAPTGAAPTGIPLRADAPAASAPAAPPASSTSRLASATGAPMRLEPPPVAPPRAAAAAPPRASVGRSVPITLPPAGGAREVGAVTDINVGWGYVVLQIDPGTVRVGDRVYARAGIEKLWMTVKRVNGTQVSAAPEVDLRRFTSDLRIYKE